ncbi:hypothetical protein [Streptomyces sp. 7N604]|uniref:hypothetical protein n=1 Tax=Streptomyces sp. 7N604 TaxID=3457415 RepID=UPI003FD082CB
MSQARMQPQLAVRERRAPLGARRPPRVFVQAPGLAPEILPAWSDWWRSSTKTR